MTPKLPHYTREIRQELWSGLDELDFAYGKTAETVNSRTFLRELDAFWPTLAGMADGVDRFAKHGIVGAPGNGDGNS